MAVWVAHRKSLLFWFAAWMAPSGAYHQVQRPLRILHPRQSILWVRLSDFERVQWKVSCFLINFYPFYVHKPRWHWPHGINFMIAYTPSLCWLSSRAENTFHVTKISFLQPSSLSHTFFFVLILTALCVWLCPTVRNTMEASNTLNYARQHSLYVT